MSTKSEVSDRLDRRGRPSPCGSVLRAVMVPVLALALPGVAVAQDAPGGASAASDLALELSNPVANLISVPLQYNLDTGIGPNDADRSLLNIQPVIPFSLNDNWNLISRTIIPLVDFEAPAPGLDDTSGVGDIVQSLFFSPKAPVGGWIIGVGPVFLLPTATEDALGSDQFGVGPTAVALRQSGGWTVGALANHIWGVNEPDDREQVNGTFIQPFLTYTTPDAWTFSLNSESTYDWNTEQWTVPVNAAVSKLVTFGKQPVSFALGYREYLETPRGRAGSRHSLRGHVPVSEVDTPLREARDAQDGPPSG